MEIIAWLIIAILGAGLCVITGYRVAAVLDRRSRRLVSRKPEDIARKWADRLRDVDW